MTDDPYLYPGSSVLVNRFGIEDDVRLDRLERELVAQRVAQGAPRGGFDLDHLRAIHHHLFQDLYVWAGQLRTVELNKDGDQFQLRRFIAVGMADVHARLKRADFLCGLTVPEFADAAGRVIGDVNYVHPFREGNGRTQLHYLAQLAGQAGHPIDLTRLDPARWRAASRASHNGDYRPMTAEIARATAGR